MNQVIMIGRLTADPQIRQTSAGNTAASYTLAVDRRFKREGEPDADFFRCAVFGKGAEFAERYLTKGIKIAITGELRTGSYTDRDGIKRYTTDIFVNTQEFVESKAANDRERQAQSAQSAGPASRGAQKTDDGFMAIPDNVDDAELPFN